jgi:hypothetical protein
MGPTPRRLATISHQPPTLPPAVSRLSRKSKSEFYYDRQSVGQSVLVSGSHLGPETNFYCFIIFGQLRICRCAAPSLARGRVCSLHFLPGLASPVFPGPSPVGLMTTFYCLNFETPPTWRAKFLYLYPPGTR